VHCPLQELLFKCIQDGVYSFPEKEWSTISLEAQNLVQHLLVRDPHERYTADEVLAHPWIHMQDSLPRSQLSTPYVLSRCVHYSLQYTCCHLLFRCSDWRITADCADRVNIAVKCFKLITVADLIVSKLLLIVDISDDNYTLKCR